MNSKKLGNSYEREIAKKLSEWVTGTDKEIIFWRNVHSGTVGTILNKKGLNGKTTSGDFVCLDNKYISLIETFNIDSKNMSKVDLCLINKKNIKSSQLFTNWCKVVDDADKVHKIPMMLVKARGNRKIPDFVMFPLSVKYNVSNTILYSIHIGIKQYFFWLINQDEFFYYNNWKTFVEENKKLLDFL